MRVFQFFNPKLGNFFLKNDTVQKNENMVSCYCNTYIFYTFNQNFHCWYLQSQGNLLFIFKRDLCDIHSRKVPFTFRNICSSYLNNNFKKYIHFPSIHTFTTLLLSSIRLRYSSQCSLRIPKTCPMEYPVSSSSFSSTILSQNIPNIYFTKLTEKTK